MKQEALARRFPRLATVYWLAQLLRREFRGAKRAAGEERPVEELLVPTPNGAQLEVAGHDLLDARVTAAPMVSSQKYDEIVPLLNKIKALEPRRVCEIGTSAGGTLYLLSRVAPPDAVLVSIDVEIPFYTRAARGRMVRPGQRLVSLEGDSHDVETKAQVEEAFAGEPIDVLFIDGDHTYDGVRRDFELYGPLVREGGLIAFHDIQPDRGGAHWSGEVPRFWEELKGSHRTEELVAEPDQDGYGIGIVYP
jgi:predicted O-methyltransferase YrrM